MNGDLPQFLKWPLIILRALELTLLATKNTDFLLHIKLDPIEAQREMLPEAQSLTAFVKAIWTQRNQRVMFVQYNHVNLRR